MSAAEQELGRGDDPTDSIDFEQMWSGEAPERPRRTFRTYVPIVVGLVIGMEVGMGLGLLAEPAPAATASIEVVPDPSLSGGVLSSDQANRFVQGQVLVLGGDDLKEAAQRAVPAAPAMDVTATQVGATDVVQITVVSSTTEGATSLTQALVEAYRDGRQQAYDDSVDASLAVVNRQLRTLQSGSSTTAERAQNSDEYSRLLSLRNSLQYNRDSAQAQVPVIEQPRALEQSRWPAAARDAFVGLVIGGLVGLLVKLLLDRRPRRATGRTRPNWS